MNKEVILSISFVLLIGFGFLVLAQENKTFIHLNKGWNLVSGFGSLSQIKYGSDISSKDIRVVYSYAAPVQQYFNLYPKPDTEKLDELNSLLMSDFNTDDDILVYGSNWVYSDKEGDLIYNQDSPAKYGIRGLNEYQIYRGWNFMPITEKMAEDGVAGVEIKDISGTCNIEKSYIFNSETQNWFYVPSDEGFNREALATGWVIKVSDDCKLGESTNAPQVPELP